MPISTSQPFYDEILSKYLYGQSTTPDNVADEAYLPKLQDRHIDISVSASDFMSGPGRFASPVFFELVNRFFQEDYATIFNAVRQSGKSHFVGTSIAIGKDDLAEVLGIGVASLSFNQGFFDDGQDDYASRLFYWSSTRFQISEEAQFIFGPDDTREIRNFAVEPVRENGGAGDYRPDDFDFDGGTLAEWAEPFVKPLVDPFGIGRDTDSSRHGNVVDIKLSGTISRTTYDQSNFYDDLTSAPRTLAGTDLTGGAIEGEIPIFGVADYPAAAAKIASVGPVFISDLYERGVIKYEKDGYNVFYGTTQNDSLFLSFQDPGALFAAYPHLAYAQTATKGAWVLGGDGNDSLSGIDFADNKLEGGEGDDSLNGGRASDDLHGGKGADKLYGGGGDDRLFADAQDTVLDGGGGDDRVDYSNSSVGINWASTNASVSSVEHVIGSSHADRLELGTSFLGSILDSSVTIDGGDGDDHLGGNDAANTLSGGSGDDHIVGEAGADTIEGGDGADNIVGGASSYLIAGDDDQLFGGGGDDTIGGGAGDDIIHGDEGNDAMVGGKGEDTIAGGSGDDIINGEDGYDVLSGDDGADRILGADGNDRIDGGSGDDILIGADGSDELVGGSGNDILDAAQSDDRVLFSSEDKLWGGAGGDTFLTNDGDVILDIDADDTVKLDGNWLNGGERTSPPANPCATPDGSDEEGEDGTYTAANGTIYRLTGTSLIVTSPPGLLGTLLSSSIRIEDFRNGDGGIRLNGSRPDTKPAECNRDPLAIDLDGDRNVVRELYDSGAYFDLDNDGFREHVAWTLDGDGLLAIDRNGNGSIDDGTELFGSGSVEFNAAGQRHGTDGFADLAAFDTNHDGLISAADEDFDALRVWIDADADGKTDAGELRTLDSLGLTSISLTTRASDDADCGCDGTEVTKTATVTFADGSKTGIYDAFFSIDQYDTREANPTAVPQALRDLPLLLGTGTVSDLDVAMARDPGLEALVRQFAGLGVGDAAQVPALVERIILRWTGADAVATDSRGVAINARWLTALERVSGSAFNQFAIGPNPRADGAAILNTEWKELVAGVTARLLGQTALGATILPGLSFAAAAFHQAAAGTTLTNVIAAAASHAPTASVDALPYWKAVVDGIAPYLEQLGATMENVAEAIAAAIPAGSLPIGVMDLAQAYIAGGASQVAIGTSEFRRVAFYISGDDVLIAQQGAPDLVGGGGSDRYFISQSLGPVSVTDSAGAHDVLALYDWQQSLTSVALTVDAFETGTELGAIDARFTIRIDSLATAGEITFAGAFVGGRLQLGIEKVAFGGGGEIDLLDLLPATTALPQGGVLAVGASGASATVAGSAGDDLLLGRSLADSYVLAEGSGSDMVIDTADPASLGDVLRIAADPAQVAFEIAGSALTDLVVRLDSGDRVTIFGQWAGAGASVDAFEFADGSRLTAAALQTMLTMGTVGDDDITGTYSGDVFDPLGGNDVARGGHGDDIYRFAKGDGTLSIKDLQGQTTLDLSGTTIDAVHVQVSPTGLVLRIDGTDDVVRFLGNRDGDNVVIRAGGIETTAHDLLFAQALRAGTVTDGTVYGTDGDDVVAGSDASELLDGMAGRDTLQGGLGNDSYAFSSGRKRIFDTGFGNDTLLIGGGYTLEDIVLTATSSSYGQMRVRIAGTDARADLGNGFVYGTGVADSFTGDDIETILFADGRTIDIGHGKKLVGTAGDDVLFSYSNGNDTFLPGAGNDRIFAVNGRHSLTETAGFGHDVFFPSFGATIRFQGIQLDEHVAFARDGYNLVISTDDGANSLTVANAYLPLNDGAFNSLVFAGATLSYADVAARIAVATDGDDLLFGGTVLDGGAGNDILISSGAVRTFVFARGYGNDTIKKQDSIFGNPGASDVLSLVGLNRDDVTFSRDAIDPLSLVITIKDTGETLTLDGTPFDAFEYNSEDSLGDGYSKGDQSGAHWIGQIEFADGTVLAQRDIEQAVIDAERTSGGDIITNFGAPHDYFGPNGAAVLDGGAGDDTYVNAFRDVFVRFAPGGGNDMLRNDLDRTAVYVQLSGLDAADVLVRFEQIDGVAYTVLYAKDGSRLAIEGQLSSTRSTSVYITDEQGEYYDASQEGGLIYGLAGGDGGDYLVGGTDGGGGEGPPPTPRSETFIAGAGDDVIAGRGGLDTIMFERGDGADILLSMQGRDPWSGQPGYFGGGYIIAVGAGIAADDVSFSWLNDGSSSIRISFGEGDTVTADVYDLLGLDFADGHTIRFGSSGIVVHSGQYGYGTSDDDVFIAPDGGVTIALDAYGGADVLRDSFVATYQPGDVPPTNWSPNRVQLYSDRNGLDDFAFIRNTDRPADLVIRNNATGASLTIENQFLTGSDAAWTPVDRNGDGTPDWSQIDVDRNGTSDFAALDPDGDGVPDWIATDLDGDGQSNWQRHYTAEFDRDGDGNSDVYANGSSPDGVYDEYFVDGPVPVWLFDNDLDGTPDQYTTDFETWLDTPTNGAGEADWLALDADGDGAADLAVLDIDGDGVIEWAPAYDVGAAGPWRLSYLDVLYDDNGLYAFRTSPDADGVTTYRIPANVNGELVARDNDGDLIPDEYGVDSDDDDIADPTPTPVTVDGFALWLTTPDETTFQYYSWLEVLPRIVEEGLGGGGQDTVIDLFALRPAATAGNDILLADQFTTIDGLGGNDRILALAGFVTVRFGAGSGNDTLISAVSADAERQNIVQLSGIDSLQQLEFLMGGADDLVIRVIATGETLTIRHQLATDEDGFARPVVETFELEIGQSVAWNLVRGFIQGTASTGDDVVSSGAEGGSLDGGTGTDVLRGGSGDDLYRFGRNYGDDTVRDAGGHDTIVFADDITPDAIYFSRAGADGNDLLVEAAGPDRQAMRIAGQFGNPNARVETFQFADGSILNWRDAQRFILAATATSGNDQLTGFATDDVIVARGGNDVISGGGGDDMIDGGVGRDVAVFRGAVGDYVITTVNGVTSVRDTAGARDGVDLLTGVEDLRFLGGGGSTVSLVPSNSTPTAGDFAVSTTEDGEIVIHRADLIAHVVDADGDTVTVTGVAAPAGGAAWIDTVGDVHFRAGANVVGETYFTYTVADANGGRGTGRVAVSVEPANDAPVAAVALDTVIVDEDRSIDVALPAILFTDPDGDTLNVTLALAGGAPLPLWLRFEGGRLVGQPPADFNGTIALEARADDGQVVSSNGFQLIVRPRNDAPRLSSSIADAHVAPGSELAIAVSQHFLDVDGDALIFQVRRTDGSDLPEWLNFDGTVLRGTVPQDFSGALDFVATASDGTTPVLASFAILSDAAQHPPIVAAPMPKVTVAEDASIDFLVPPGTFTDADGDALILSATQSDGGALPSWLHFENGHFTGTPPLNFSGSVAIAVTASDGHASATSSFALEITPVNDAPTTIQSLAPRTVAEDAQFDFTVPAGTFADVDGDALLLSVSLIDGSPLPAWLTFDASVGKFSGTPTNPDVGTVDIRVTASDPVGSGASTQFALTVVNVNDVPVVLQPLASATIAEDTAFEFVVPAGTFADIDGDALQLTATLGDGSSLPSWLGFDAEHGRFSGTPGNGDVGSFDIRVTASDPDGANVNAQFALVVTNVNDAPTATGLLDEQFVDQGAAFNLVIPATLFADVDTDDVLSVTVKQGDGTALPGWLHYDAAARVLSGTPGNSDVGTLSLVVTATDLAGAGVSTPFALTIADINDPPTVDMGMPNVTVLEDAAVDFAVSAQAFRDIDGDALTLSAQLVDGSALPTWLGFDGMRFTGTPPQDFAGSFAIRLTASDGAASAAIDFILTLSSVNDAPMLTALLPDVSGIEDTAVNFTLPSGSFADVDNATLTYTAMMTNGSALPSWLIFDAASQRFTGTPPTNVNGFIDVRVTASDGSLSAFDDFRLTIAPVNDAPVTNNPSGSIQAGTVATGAIAATDVDGDTLSFALAVGPGHGTATVNGVTGAYSYTAATDYIGTDSFTVQVSDGHGGIANALVNYTVTAGGTAIYGTPGNDSISGTSGNDIIYGLGGSDGLYGSGGNDVIDGNDGNDTLTGDAGNDTLIGGAGTDSLYGGSGNDSVDGGDGNDVATGDDGADALTGGAGNDQLYAGAGNDSVDGGDGDDMITGDAGADILAGGNGNDYVYAGDGDDIVDGGVGNDTLTGDGGNDVIAPGSGNDTVYAGSGIDKLSYAGSMANWTINLGANTAVSGSETDGVYDFEGVVAGSGSDIIIGTAAANILDGAAGDDLLSGGAGNDTLVGGAGLDVAIFAGTQGSYSIVTSGGIVSVKDNAPSTDGNDGTDTVSGIEKVQFKGGVQVGISSPIVLDLDGDGVELVDRNLSQTRFDWDGDGRLDRTGWVGADDGLLVYDRDGDGTVTSAAELSFVEDKLAAKSDLDGLSAFDSNGDGILSATDEKFLGFHVWRDGNANGKVDGGELLTLETAGIASIALAGDAVEQSWEWNDNPIVNNGSYVRSDGTSAQLADVAFSYSIAPAAGLVELLAQGSALQAQRPEIARAVAQFAEALAAFGPGGGAGDRFGQSDQLDRHEAMFAPGGHFPSR